VAVVGQAVWGMSRTLTPDWQRLGVALVALGIVMLFGGAGGQVAAIVLGALAGLWLCRGAATPLGMALSVPVARRHAVFALGLFALLLLLPAFGTGQLHQGLHLFTAFYRSGALVFGGGHVVLPLLQAAVVQPGWVSNNNFIAGYGLAQAVPGPLFTFAAYLGAVVAPSPSGVAGAAIALIGIFLPGLLLVYGMLPFWDALRRRILAQAAMRGANAAVVGILAAAFYNPVWTNAVSSSADIVLAAAGFMLLTIGKAPPWAVVILLALAGALQSVFSL
jgi:chromate transporter